MWRNEQQIVLNAIIVANQEISDHYRYAAELVEDDTLTGLFGELAGTHQSITDQLIVCIERAGGLPDLPDQDRETMQQLVSQFKSLFAQNSSAVFMEERKQAEKELEQLIEPALMLSWEKQSEPQVKQLLLQLKKLTARAQQRLTRAGQRL